MEHKNYVIESASETVTPSNNSTHMPQSTTPVPPTTLQSQQNLQSTTQVPPTTLQSQQTLTPVTPVKKSNPVSTSDDHIIQTADVQNTPTNVVASNQTSAAGDNHNNTYVATEAPDMLPETSPTSDGVPNNLTTFAEDTQHITTESTNAPDISPEVTVPATTKSVNPTTSQQTSEDRTVELCSSVTEVNLNKRVNIVTPGYLNKQNYPTNKECVLEVRNPNKVNYNCVNCLRPRDCIHISVHYNWLLFYLRNG